MESRIHGHLFMRKPRREKESNDPRSPRLRLTHFIGPAIILLAALIAAGPLLVRGPSCISDFAFHYISWIDAEHSMSKGILYPHWANSPNFGAGEPKFVFYPPLTWMMGAVLGVVLPWTLVPVVFFILLLFATGMANRALARMALPDAPATLAGCTSIFLGFALFSIYRRNDFGELAGGFLIPLLLLFALRRRNPSGNFWKRTFDGSATPLALVVAGIWLTNGPAGIMADYLLVAVALVSALVEKSLLPLVRAAVSTTVGMGLASLYLIPAIWERGWVSIQSALVPAKYVIENNWLFGMHGDPRVAADDPLLLQASIVAVAMLAVAFACGAVASMRGVVPGERKWWLPLALIPPAVLFLLLPVSHFVWNSLPGLRLLQFPWRWLVILEAPMAICFASAVWFDRKPLRNVVVAASAVVFLGLSIAAPVWWFVECGTLIDSLEVSARQGIGVIGKPEYAPPGIRSALSDFKVDAQGKLLMDSQGSPIIQTVPDACLLDSSPENSAPGEAGSPPAWSGDSADCKSAGWRQLSLLADPSLPQGSRYLPEQKWFTGNADHAGYLVLHLRYYPAWAAKVNGIPVTAMAEQARGLMAVPVPKGNVLVSVDWSTTGDVVAGRWVSLASLLLLAVLFLFERNRLLFPSSMRGPNPLIAAEAPKPSSIGEMRSASSARPDPQNKPSGNQPKTTSPKKADKPKRGR